MDSGSWESAGFWRPRARISAQLASELTGSLEQLPFPALLHYLHGLRATGVLHLRSGRKRKWIQLREGLPASVRSNVVNECLGNYLLRAGRIDRATFDQSVRCMQEGRLQGEILVAMEVLSEEEVAEALRVQADEKLFEVFTWESGSFRFETGAQLQSGSALGAERSPANLILHGVQSFFPHPSIQAYLERHRGDFVAAGESPFYRFQEVDLGPEQETLLRKLEGPCLLADLIYDDEYLQRSLYGLLATGLLELREGEQGAPPSGIPGRGEKESDAATQGEDRRGELAALAERFSRQSPFEILIEVPHSIKL